MTSPGSDIALINDNAHKLTFLKNIIQQAEMIQHARKTQLRCQKAISDVYIDLSTDTKTSWVVKRVPFSTASVKQLISNIVGSL